VRRVAKVTVEQRQERVESMESAVPTRERNFWSSRSSQAGGEPRVRESCPPEQQQWVARGDEGGAVIVDQGDFGCRGRWRSSWSLPTGTCSQQRFKQTPRAGAPTGQGTAANMAGQV
jgi:hypothetical protein